MRVWALVLLGDLQLRRWWWAKQKRRRGTRRSCAGRVSGGQESCLGSGRWSRTDQVGGQSSVKLVDADGHLETVEGVGHDVVGIDVVASASDLIGVGLLGAGEEQELCAGGSLETGQTEMRRLERLDAGGLVCTIAGRCRRGCDGAQRARDGMDAVKGTGQNEIVVGIELLKARRKVAVVDESTGLVDDEQSEDDPAVRMLAMVPRAPELFVY
jgi:hypothetical protein